MTFHLKFTQLRDCRDSVSVPELDATGLRIILRDPTLLIGHARRTTSNGLAAVSKPRLRLQIEGQALINLRSGGCRVLEIAIRN